MDIPMPGIEATARICGAPETAGVKVLILTTFDLDEYIYAALRAGAEGFLLKDAPPAEVLAAIPVVAEGDSLLAPSVTRRLIEEFTSRADPAPAPHRDAVVLTGVTRRELEVLRLIARGRSNDEITARLHLSVGTVKTRIGRLLTKLAARDRAQLVIAAYEAGVVSPEGRRPTAGQGQGQAQVHPRP